MTSKVINVAFKHVEILSIPSWDTAPYNITSPNKSIISKRAMNLAKINKNFVEKKTLILSTFNALFIKNSPFSFYNNLSISLFVNQKITPQILKNDFGKLGYVRVEVVREIGEFSIRGDIVDIFTTNFDDPIRINFNDDLIEKIILFDPFTQRNKPNLELKKLIIFSTKELLINDKNIKILEKYLEHFHLDLKNDSFYNQIISQYHADGIENYLSLFYDVDLSNIFEFIMGNKSLMNDLKFYHLHLFTKN